MNLAVVVAWHSNNTFHAINEVTLRQVGLVPEHVNACGQINHLGN